MVDTERDSLLEAVRSAVAAAGGARITRQQFLASSGLKLSDLFRHFPKWSDALNAAGFTFDGYNERIEPDELLTDWATLVRKLERLPTRNEYRLQGTYSAGVFDAPEASLSDAREASPKPLREAVALDRDRHDGFSRHHVPCSRLGK